MTAPRPTRRPEAAATGRLTLGLAASGGAWGAVDEGESLATIEAALAGSVSALDAAPSYGVAETVLGRALADWKGPAPLISTKAGRLPAPNAQAESYDFSATGLRDSVHRSRDRIGVATVDVLFLHEPQCVPPPERPRVAAALQQLRADGLVRRLGLAGGHGADWDGLLDAGVNEVVMLFRRLDACIFDGLIDDRPRLARAGAEVWQASPLHMGLLGARFEEFSRDRPEWVWAPQIARAARLRELASAHGLTLPALAHRFALSVAELDRIVIGAGNRAHLAATLQDFEAGPLPEELFDAVCRINSD